MILEIIFIVLAVCIFVPLIYTMAVGAVYVPTSHQAVRRIISLAKIKPGMVIYDLGCGDGRIVRAATQKGAKAIGIEVFWPVFLWAYIKKIWHKSPAKIVCRDMLKVDLSDADIVFIYQMPHSITNHLQSKFKKELKPGAKIISYAFQIPGFNELLKTTANKEKDIQPIFIYEI